MGPYLIGAARRHLRAARLFDPAAFPTTASTAWLIGGEAPAAAIWGAATCLAEQHRCPATLKRAQMEVDLEPELYKHSYLNEIPERFHAQ